MASTLMQHQKLKRPLEAVLQFLYRSGVRYYMTACATPEDLLYAETVLLLSKQAYFREMNLICILPKPAQDLHPDRRLRKILHKSSRTLSSDSMEACHGYMQENAQFFVALYHRLTQEPSELTNLIQQARTHRRTIYLIDPNSFQISSDDTY